MIEDSTNERWHTFPWEENYLGDDGADWIYSQVSTDSFHDRGMEPDDDFGIALFDSDADETSDFGIIIDEVGSAVTSDVGAGTDIIDPAGQLLLISKNIPNDLSSMDDESDFPAYLRKYVEYDVLERAYGANTDGRIPSLADYWGWRKEIGYKIVKRFRWKKLADRDFCMQTQGIPARNVRRRPKLPDTYPAQW